LGYVGVAGRVPIAGMSSTRSLETLGVDHRLVRRDPTHLCGICLALQSDGERTLLTHAGANAFMADHIKSAFDDLVEYLAATRIVHVTSFLDPRTAQCLLAVLDGAKRRNPHMRISFDPGHVWSTARTIDIDRIIGLSDFLLMNYREFKQIGGRS